MYVGMQCVKSIDLSWVGRVGSVGSEEWGVGSGEWGVGSEEWGVDVGVGSTCLSVSS